MPRNPLKPRLPPKDPKTGRRKRRRFKKQGSRPGMSEKMRALWQDPEYRAKMAERDRVRREDQQRNPDKYKRTAIPDGMTKEMAAPLWERAHQLADKFIQILKDNGQL